MSASNLAAIVGLTYTYHWPGCTCPHGGWWGIHPPPCPVHNPPAPSPYTAYRWRYTPPSVVTTDRTTITVTPRIPVPRPEGDAMRADEV